MSQKIKKKQIIFVDSEYVCLSGTNKISKKKLIIEQIPANIIFILLMIFIVASNGFYLFKQQFFFINKNNYNPNQIQTEYSKENISEYHEIINNKYINNYFKDFELIKINEIEAKKYFEYLNYAKNGLYLYQQNLEKIENPKVSIIISIYNREDYIISTIRSIQNQNMKEIEIILIDDYSSDNSVNNIKEEQKKDPRIVLYQNKQNMGTLYSKSIGVLLANGEYIYSLNSGDMFCSENYLNSLYTLAKENNYNYVHSKALNINLITKSIVKVEPLSTILWTNLIETEYYRNTVYSIGYNALYNKVNILEDDIISKLMKINKKNNVIIKEIGVGHFIYPEKKTIFGKESEENKNKEHCLNIANTIKAIYKIFEIKAGNKFAKILIKKYFYKGICSKFKNEEIVKELLSIYKINKKKKRKKIIRKKKIL